MPDNRKTDGSINTRRVYKTTDGRGGYQYYTVSYNKKVWEFSPFTKKGTHDVRYCTVAARHTRDVKKLSFLENTGNYGTGNVT